MSAITEARRILADAEIILASHEWRRLVLHLLEVIEGRRGPVIWSVQRDANAPTLAPGGKDEPLKIVTVCV